MSTVAYEDALQFLIVTSTGSGVAAHLVAVSEDDTLSVESECFVPINSFSPTHVAVEGDSVGKKNIYKKLLLLFVSHIIPNKIINNK